MLLIASWVIRGIRTSLNLCSCIFINDSVVNLGSWSTTPIIDIDSLLWYFFFLRVFILRNVWFSVFVVSSIFKFLKNGLFKLWKFQIGCHNLITSEEAPHILIYVFLELFVTCFLWIMLWWCHTIGFDLLKALRNAFKTAIFEVFSLFDLSKFNALTVIVYVRAIWATFDS